MNRVSLFIDWWAWSVRWGDCDPAVWMTNYLNNRYEHNTEEKYWMSWLYANTYQLPTAWVMKMEFPDYELATVSRMVGWQSENRSRLRYQTDTKWNRGHLHSMFESYQKFVGKRDQKQVFEDLLGDSEEQSFYSVFSVVKDSLYKFGRYNTWFYLQHLKHTCGLACDPPSLLLSDYSGSRSHRNGLLYAVDRESECDKKMTAAEYSSLETLAADIKAEAKRKYPKQSHMFDFYTMETCLCSFKKLFRHRESRYLGYYLDRQAEEIKVAEGDKWDGIDWNVLWQARQEIIDERLLLRNKINKELYGEYIDYGTINKLDWIRQ